MQLQSEIAADVVVKTKDDGTEAIMKEDLGMDDAPASQPQDQDIEDVQIPIGTGQSDDIYRAYEIVHRNKSPEEEREDTTDEIVDMYGKRADGSKRQKASFFEELWAKQHPDEAK